MAAVFAIALSVVMSIKITLEIQSKTVECPIEVIVAVWLGIAGVLA